MEYEKFDAMLGDIYELERMIGRTKALEYTQGADRLDNFKRLAKDLNMDPRQVLWIYLKKHLDSIRRYCATGEVLSEDITGRILDARVYLSLLWGLHLDLAPEAVSRTAIMYGLSAP